MKWWALQFNYQTLLRGGYSMATVGLTLEQILGAVEQLSPADRKQLQRELARRESSTKTAPAINRMPRRKARRMSELLLKANSGALTSAENAELNSLVDEFESLTLSSAEALAKRNDTNDRAGGSRRSTKQ
jgi:hypothetical protein